ncbi:cell division protein ZapE [Asticcacaulis excentricus]|uniref:AFG1-family ATPase n=1 Tax=Asticcacaulis excentricus (strain ATCC 15261 / DSM 4724 / KCTC 12464 / NCIMB 9791 / VKM B-1370 / CB 48) TaxID=573065 RepID=E8RQ16_ASTEC|nr:cell division protein ZapE [Asticcacaulis excentricus]ADU12073.1 AFG1-family ATPase [Asticcacaulis excentricus CB 48]
MSGSVKSAYKQLIKSRQIAADPGQAEAVDVLSKLERTLRDSAGFWQGLFGGAHCYGLYLWGQPGRGKSMLMDLFYDHVAFEPKRRIHFHAFMAKVHELVQMWRQGDAKERQSVFGTSKGDDPVAPVARLIARESKLLCFDELQVTDIADAMILGRLFEALFAQKVTIVITSNRAPEDLYKNGLNRDLFVPFIDMIRSQMTVHEVRGPKDFRLDRLRGARVYFTPDDAASKAAYDVLWRDMVGPGKAVATTLSVNERKLTLKRTCGPLLRASFAELCAENNGPADYLAIAERFTTVFIDHIPQLGPEKRNEAKRFVTLIDALYEANTKLVVLAAAEPAALYPAGDGAFEFERTVSRLEEMRSQTYLEKVTD